MVDFSKLILYRADRAGNKTSPEIFFSEGLFTKQLNSGDNPLPHQKYGWLKTIKNHINYTSDIGKLIYDTTQYLSFTTDIWRAFYYLSSGNNFNYCEVDRDDAEAFIFTATINKIELKEVGKGLFIYTYKCNYNKTKTDLKFRSRLSIFIKCNICSEHQGYDHKLLIIDAKTFLEQHKSTYAIEYELASENKEWLLMPLDPMIGVNATGYQSRIQIADFWTVDFFSLKG